MSRERRFEAEQRVELPRPQVFAFFCEPANLERITPPWLRFRIVGRSTPAIGPGTELTYRLRLRGLPLTWVSRITDWEPGVRFTDIQVRGPYARWEHTHTFRESGTGTVIGDQVVYRLPFAPLGDWLAGRLVAGDVRRIFEFRRRRIEVLLGGVPGPVSGPAAGAG